MRVLVNLTRVVAWLSFVASLSVFAGVLGYFAGKGSISLPAWALSMNPLFVFLGATILMLLAGITATGISALDAFEAGNPPADQNDL